MLSRKYYREIAEIIKESEDLVTLVGGLCIYFKRDNPNFDESKFLKATGGYDKILE